MWEETVAINGPYQFDLALQRLSLDPLHTVHIEERTIKMPIYNEVPEVAKIVAIGSMEQPVFKVEGEHLETKDAVLERIATIFQWNANLAEIERHLSATSLKPILTKHRGTPLVLDFSHFACLAKCIIHQQLNMAFARTLTERFVHTFGFEKDGVWFYPDAETIAERTVQELRELQFSERKAEYIIGLSKMIASGELNVEELQQKSDADILKQLTKIRGIGPWTVQNFLMFGLGRQNLFPKADIGIQNAIRNLFQFEQKPTYEQMDMLAKEWEPYLSYASLYLWRSIE
ncbi:DNA-3-methyladenine glycosylase family protein [Heyndrickxia ginsengihumi]|uniref:DNA-3-methyladenine glycosylase II n=1 Tax=Heyndrickxia ginsengihumi TaxID=363870 RepID=A0A0A6VDR2_9BACI|nr:DNA-3-methyladenine glycosylase [Heyndrickxia ginsengihumi]KHD85628.1 DNA-3-methyladenine glycosylase [Heyndrickxia ginsengihumi]MCM3024184.1 DNA-3-methyladenine glycosylase [Heyndrickxia ginsengihumi]NEY21411.1 DNA-3-methyladenine glycosylase 2 family protein [Heyndrickxia ginsengihumi]